jgi:hypothetical protein
MFGGIAVKIMKLTAVAFLVAVFSFDTAVCLRAVARQYAVYAATKRARDLMVKPAATKPCKPCEKKAEDAKKAKSARP